MRWTYFIEDIQVFPMNTRSYKIKNELEDEYIHAYRKTLDGEPVFVGDDYDYIKTLESEHRFEKFTFKIYDNSVEHFAGEFTINDCSFDDYKHNCSITITPRDQYTVIQECEDIEVNVIAKKYNVIGDVYSYISIELKTRADITPYESDPADETYRKLISWYKPITVNNLDDYVYWALYASERIIVPNSDIFDDTGWNLLVELDDYKVYRRFPTAFDPTSDIIMQPDSIIPSTTELVWSVIEDSTMHNQNESDWIYTKLIPTYDIQSWILTTYKDDLFKELGVWTRKSYYNGRFNSVYTRNYSAYKLQDTLNRILQTTTSFTGVIKSSLLFHDTAETGKIIPSDYTDLWVYYYEKYLIEMSDFRRPNATQAATKENTTWKKIIEYLCVKHNLRWHIDTDGNLRLEHISYYDTSDISISLYSDLNITLKYSYLESDKPNREYLTESQSWNEDFKQIEILYGTVPALNGVKESTKTKSLSDLYTDIDGLNTHLDELSDNGFVYVDVVSGAVVKNTGFKTGETNLQNASLSNANCLNLYYRHDAFQDEFKIGGVDVEAITLKKMKTQELVFINDMIPDVEKKMVSRIGIGQFKSLSYAPVEEYNFKAELLYE